MSKHPSVERMKGILKSHGIGMSVGACGCCGSPWISFSHNGEIIVDDLSDANFDMVQDEKEANECQPNTADGSKPLLETPSTQA